MDIVFTDESTGTDCLEGGVVTFIVTSLRLGAGVLISLLYPDYDRAAGCFTFLSTLPW